LRMLPLGGLKFAANMYERKMLSAKSLGPWWGDWDV